MSVGYPDDGAPAVNSTGSGIYQGEERANRLQLVQFAVVWPGERTDVNTSRNPTSSNIQEATEHLTVGKEMLARASPLSFDLRASRTSLN